MCHDRYRVVYSGSGGRRSHSERRQSMAVMVEGTNGRDAGEPRVACTLELDEIRRVSVRRSIWNDSEGVVVKCERDMAFG